MTCKDCIHHEVCKEDNTALCGYALVESTAENCDYFKDKSRFIELPCKVGNTIYQLDTAGRIYESKVSEIIYACSGFAFDKSAIGKRVFLTYEEAEKKAKEREENGNA